MPTWKAQLLKVSGSGRLLQVAFRRCLSSRQGALTICELGGLASECRTVGPLVTQASTGTGGRVRCIGRSLTSDARKLVVFDGNHLLDLSAWTDSCITKSYDGVCI